jgi:hypothetical protein
MNTWASGSGPETSRRRSRRVLLHVPVTVSSEDPKNEFSEQTSTLVVNAHGALITLQTKAVQNQKLFISTSASEKRPCRVVHVGPTLQGSTQYGIEFAEPAPNFWHITFPPEDWAGSVDLAEPKKK